MSSALDDLRAKAEEMATNDELTRRHADEQMREGGRFCGHCCICGKALTDPISIELGIGPECRHKFEVTVPKAPGAWIIGRTKSVSP